MEGTASNSVDLSDRVIPDESLFAILENLRTDTTATSLNLKGVGLQGRRLTQLSRVLSSNNTMTRWALGYNSFVSSPNNQYRARLKGSLGCVNPASWLPLVAGCEFTQSWVHSLDELCILISFQNALGMEQHWRWCGRVFCFLSQSPQKLHN